MGLFFRKSQKVGPFRINFSTSGVGISTGVTGARVSVGPRGTFVHLGRHGVYYRKKVGVDNPMPNGGSVDPTPTYEQREELHSITTLNFDQLTDSDSQEFIKELEEKDRKIRYLPIFGILLSFLILVFYWTWSTAIIDTTEIKQQFFKIEKQVVNLRNQPSTSSEVVSKAEYGQQLKYLGSADENWSKILTLQNDTAYVHNSLGNSVDLVTDRIQKTRFYGFEWLQLVIMIMIVGALIFWMIFLHRLDKKRKSIELYYAMEEEMMEMYDKFLSHFKEFSKSSKIWQKLHTERATDTKYTGGAGSLVRRIPIGKVENDSKPTPFIKTNVELPHLKLKNTDLYFFPERLILKRNRKFAAVMYKNLLIDSGSIRFIEDGGVPRDAIVVDHTWKYVNKSGGPDKRFKDNRKLPICKYSEYHFQSSGGVNEVIKTSKHGAMDNFANFIIQIGKLQTQLN